MWASEEVRNEAIRKMLGPVRAGRWWTADGPTTSAVMLVEQVKGGGSPLSSGERVLLQAAFDLWNGAGDCKVADLLACLDEDNLRLVAEAILTRDRE